MPHPQQRLRYQHVPDMLVCNKHSSAAAKESETKTTRRGENGPKMHALTHIHIHTQFHAPVIHSTNHKPERSRRGERREGGKVVWPSSCLSPPLPQPGAGGICQSSGRQPTNTSPVMQPNGIELQCRGRIWMPIFAEYTGSCVAKPPTAPLATSMRILPCRSFFSSYLS